MLLSKHSSVATSAIPILSSVMGLSIALSCLRTQSAQAAQFFDFTATWSDGSIGNGSFSLSDTPTEARLINELDYEFSYSARTWNPLSDFTYSYLGQTYTSSNSAFTIDDYPDGRYYADQYGSFLKDFNFSIQASNFYTFMFLVDAEIDSKDSFQGLSQILDADNQVISSSDLISLTLKERTAQGETPSEPGTGGSHPGPDTGEGNPEPGVGGSAPEPPQSQSVPEPGMIGSLFLLGLRMIARGGKGTAQRSA